MKQQAGILKLTVLPLTREWIEMMQSNSSEFPQTVLPLTREWIEMEIVVKIYKKNIVLPLTREWIEILDICTNGARCARFSLLRGSGLK